MSDVDRCFTKNNYFALFDLPVQFDIDKAALKNKLLDLQKKYHPDNHSPNASTSSTLINTAFEVLNSNSNRAIYLLELAGQMVNLDHSIDAKGEANKAFLNQMMGIRMDLEDAKESNNAEQIAQLSTQIADLEATIVQQFAQAFHSKNWQHAQNHALQLKFLAKLSEDMNLSDTSDDADDDLYV